MKIEDLGEQVLKDYKSVKYFPFENEAGAPYILTSDPLSYLEAWLDSKLVSIKRDGKSKRNNFKKAKYFTQLSIDFYHSAKFADMPSKGTLIYYSFVNLVKVFLIINGYDLETQIEHHGLSLPSTSTIKLKLNQLSGNGISIFHEFAKSIGKEVDPAHGSEVEFTEFLRNLPEVHEIGYALDLFPATKRKFLPVDIKIMTNPTRKKIYYTISYEKKFDKLMQTKKLTSNKIFKDKIALMDIENDQNRKYFKSVMQVSYTKDSNKSWKICYPKIIEDITELNITPMLTRQGYRFLHMKFYVKDMEKKKHKQCLTIKSKSRKQCICISLNKEQYRCTYMYWVNF